MKPLLAVAVVLAIAAGAYLMVGLEGRVDALEARPAIGEMAVVGKEFRQAGATSQVCVRYHAFGRTEETCVFDPKCYNDARIGEPLPASCR